MAKIDFDELVKKASHKRNSVVSAMKKANKSLNGKKIIKEMFYINELISDNSADNKS
jgi:hypothetical protein